MERFSILDRKPTHVLGFPLTIGQQLWLSFLLPAFFLLAIYIAEVATCISVGLQLLSERHYLASSFTLILLYLPPLVSYLSRLGKPPDTKDVGVVYAWFFTETAAFILFPIRPLQCLGERLFWAIEALRHEDPEREEALEEYEKTRCKLIETYFFSQAFLEAGPQILLQASFLATHLSSEKETVILQGACVLSSLTMLAVVTSTYERYESQVDGGRYQVWSRGEYHHTQLQTNKAMDEDNPIGKLCLFLFWFFFLTSRMTSLVLAGSFYPWVVLGVSIAHILLSFLYLLPSGGYKNSIGSKIFLSLIYLLCIVEVNVRLRKSNIFYVLYYTLTVAENAALTVLWAVQARSGNGYNYAFYFLAITHLLAFVFLLIYTKFLKPQTREIIIHEDNYAY